LSAARRSSTVPADFVGVSVVYELSKVMLAAFMASTVLPGMAEARPPELDCGRGQGLGVSRIEVVDTAGGPRFGRQFQGDGTSFLAPGEIVLTFDDGPFAVSTRSILATLDRFCAKATFFAVGRMAIIQPETLKEIARRGHTIAGHTWAHVNVAHVGEMQRIAEVEKGFSALTEVLGAPIVAPFFRFPYLNAPESELERLSQRNVAVFGIDVDSTDSRGQHAPMKRIVERTLAGLEKTGKGIILLHDLKATTAAALPDLLAALKEKGYRLVHLVPKRSFEPNAAFSAEVAEVILKRQQSIDAKAGRLVAAAPSSGEFAGNIRPVRHLSRGKAHYQRTVKSGKTMRKGRTKRSSAQQIKAGPFGRI
jgi:peptidoglycan/xylan/chitin deacetylase (PgdA/CDA1 family)